MVDDITKHSYSKRNIFGIIFFLLIIAIFFFAKYYLLNLVRPHAEFTFDRNDACELREQACKTSFEGTSVMLSITPKTIPLLKPLQIDVKIEGLEVYDALIDFSGIGMDMGFNRSKLKRTDKGHFTGKATLPVCTRSKMDWEAKVMLQTEKGLMIAPFRFFTLK